MKVFFQTLFFIGALAGHLSAESDLRELLNNDPKIVYAEELPDVDLSLEVAVDAAVFSNTKGSFRLGTLLKGQTVKIEAMTRRAYRVRGKGSNGGIAGWVSPKAFVLPTEDYVERMQKKYDRQQEVKAIIAEGEVAIGMTQDEVKRSLGEPTETRDRHSSAGTEAVWGYVDYEEQKHFNLVRNPLTGQLLRQFSHVSQQEISRRNIEFKEGLVTAVQTSKRKTISPTRRVISPILIVP